MAKTTWATAGGGIGTDYNPVTPTTYAGSGSNNGSGVTQDWYVHTQSVDSQYLRVNNYDYSASTPFTSPSILNSNISFTFKVQTNDQIIYNGNFHGDQVQLQTLEIITDSATGFGTKGAVNTSSMGLIRRAARKDANGNILDPTGVCITENTINLDYTPGVFDETYDTSGNMNGIMGQLVNSLATLCPTFSPTLVDL